MSFEGVKEKSKVWKHKQAQHNNTKHTLKDQPNNFPQEYIDILIKCGLAVQEREQGNDMDSLSEVLNASSTSRNLSLNRHHVRVGTPDSLAEVLNETLNSNSNSSNMEGQIYNNNNICFMPFWGSSSSNKAIIVSKFNDFTFYVKMKFVDKK